MNSAGQQPRIGNSVQVKSAKVNKNANTQSRSKERKNRAAQPYVVSTKMP